MEQLYLGQTWHPLCGAGRRGLPPQGTSAFLLKVCLLPTPCSASKPSDMLAPSLPPCSTHNCHIPRCLEIHHPGAAWLPAPQHGRSWEGPRSLENVSLAHRQQLTTLCSRRPGAPAVLISIIQAPCVSHSPSPLGFLLPVNKHVALRFLDGGLCREQCWPQTDHHQGLIFPSAGFYLQHDERLFLPLCILSNHIYCGELYFLLCFAGNTDIRGIFPAIQFPSI